MEWFKRVKRHFDEDRYDENDVKVFVVAGKITEEEYMEITNVEYVA